jgi:multicomponent Na+:H+ antiporter subunit G
MRDIAIAGLMLMGTFFMFLAGIGILRMPDLFLRMSATAKAGTLGAGLVVLGAALSFNDFGIFTRALAIIVFLLLTAPVAAHLIGRAAYFDGVPLWSGTIQDDLHGHYRASNHALENQEVPLSDQTEGVED